MNTPEFKMVSMDEEMVKAIVDALCRADYEGYGYTTEATKRLVDALHNAFPNIVDRDYL